MKPLTEMQRTRIAWWTVTTMVTRRDDQLGANVRAAYYGDPVPYPELVPSEQEAISLLREIVSQCRVLKSRFIGEDTLTDEPIRIGTEIYYNRENPKLTLTKAKIDDLLGG